MLVAIKVTVALVRGARADRRRALNNNRRKIARQVHA